MHEASLVSGLITKLTAISRDEGSRIVSVRVRLGALSQISPQHFREHFEHAASGTCVDGVHLDVESLTDLSDPRAQEILLESVELET